MQLIKRLAKNTFGCLVGCAIGDLELYIVFKNIMLQIAFQMICGTWFWGVAMASGIATA